MKIALLSITNNGRTIVNNIYTQIIDDPTVIKVNMFHKNIKETLDNIFNSYDCILGVMATGIMVRNICTLIKNKGEDPAVLVTDEKGKYVISLISGHLGGANIFTEKIADIIGADPIITTSTDINNKLGIDSLARKYYLKIDDISKIKHINSGLIYNKKIEIAFNPKLNYIWNDLEVKKSYYKSSNKSNTITVSKDLISINLKPQKLVVGIGSRKDISGLAVINAIKNALNILGLPVERVDLIATGEMKQNENGIIDAAQKLNIKLEIISENLLKNYKNLDLNNSDFVKEKFGVGGVCEPSSLIAAGNDSLLIFKKTSYNGVTVAVAVSKN
ncbi:MAG: cobalt-precorrin 5A hydrolase [Methanobacterium sp.]|nr:cobalt-precorrin 5A hydrolase [Methanobacterium sp.]